VGSGAGVVNEYPLVRQIWSGNSRGDLRIGAKFNLVSQADSSPVSFALKGSVKLPTGNDSTGASTGKTDFDIDAVLSGETGKTIELTATAGYVKRGDPDGFELMNGIRWGVGAAFPTRSHLRVTTEVHGERYVGSGGSNKVIAPANFKAVDGSIAPITTIVKHPMYVAAGLTWQSTGGFFIGGGLNWSSAVKDRVVGDNGLGDKLGIQFRIGYHPGVRTEVHAMAAPPVVEAPPVVAPPVVSAPPANRPPTARATCDPCTVEVGKISTITAVCSDPDGDTLTYRWVTNSGTIANNTARQTTWTAPMTVGAVPITLTCTDTGGLSANADVTIQVIQPAVKEYVFEDVHFDFDRNTLRPDALAVLDEAIAAMKASPTLKLNIEGHTCNIGTAEYNMALGNRRATAVRDYLVSRGITADRLTTVSYGEERPKHDNEREETRRLNRRAALVVTVVRYSWLTRGVHICDDSTQSRPRFSSAWVACRRRPQPARPLWAPPASRRRSWRTARPCPPARIKSASRRSPLQRWSVRRWRKLVGSSS
jgi:outer membrane protein OmpA-like peptidoglycan-associated protein